MKILIRALIEKLQKPVISCDCNSHGSLNETCDPDTERCTCYDRYMGRLCNGCKNGLYNFPECVDCGCNVVGTFGAVCDKTSGKCFCNERFEGAKCDSCKWEFVIGEICDRCPVNYYGYPKCKGSFSNHNQIIHILLPKFTTPSLIYYTAEHPGN